MATGDNIHARRFLDMRSDYFPCIKLYSPVGSMKISLSGFDTKEGLNPLYRILSEERMNDEVISKIPDFRNYPDL